MKNTNISLFDLLIILFVALKLMGYIEWSWFLVLSPLWIQILIIIVLTYSKYL